MQDEVDRFVPSSSSSFSTEGKNADCSSLHVVAVGTQNDKLVRRIRVVRSSSHYFGNKIGLCTQNTEIDCNEGIKRPQSPLSGHGYYLGSLIES